MIGTPLKKKKIENQLVISLHHLEVSLGMERKIGNAIIKTIFGKKRR